MLLFPSVCNYHRNPSLHSHNSVSLGIIRVILPIADSNTRIMLMFNASKRLIFSTMRGKKYCPIECNIVQFHNAMHIHIAEIVYLLLTDRPIVEEYSWPQNDYTYGPFKLRGAELIISIDLFFKLRKLAMKLYHETNGSYLIVCHLFLDIISKTYTLSVNFMLVNHILQNIYYNRNDNML